uniref:Bromo domain-containing protein n=1 Tax=Dracunculus medinensis TaxID=318479 RepID=A0A158Q3Z3_DRAME
LKRKPLMYDAVAINSAVSVDSVKLLAARELLGRRNSMESLELHCRICGHLSSIFCVTFDRTGLFVITGADDHLVKVWSVMTGLLRFTLRGHSSEISDMSVSHDNTLLATGSVDKSVRIWNLQTAATITVFYAHSATVTLVFFSPFISGNRRYLVSTGGDCVVNFFAYNAENHLFDVSPVSFNERMSQGARIISSSHSVGGNFVVMGDTHRFVRIYKMASDGIEKCFEIEAHKDRVDSLVWAHSGLQFASGSRDGTARVWKFSCNEWESLVLSIDDTKKNANGRGSYRVIMLCWSLEDDMIITSGTDHILHLWCPKTGASKGLLIGHKDDAYVLFSHPVYREYIISAGHDGFLIVWNIYKENIVRKHQNMIEGIGYGAFFDCAISPDGTIIAAVDAQGHLSVYGVGTNQLAKTTPKEQFYHTDYMTLIMDEDGFCLDEELGLPPHLMPPPIFVNADGNPYPALYQRLVPGRDILIDSSLNEVLESAWMSRMMVQSLPVSTITIEIERLKQLQEWECRNIEKECARKKPSVGLRMERSPQYLNRDAPVRRRNSASRRISVAQQASLQQTNVTETYETNAEIAAEEVEIDEIISSSSSEDYTYSSVSPRDEHSASSTTSSEADLSEDDDSFADDSDYHEPSSRSLNRPKRKGHKTNIPEFTETRRRSSRKRRNVVVIEDDNDEIQLDILNSDQPQSSNQDFNRIAIPMNDACIGKVRRKVQGEMVQFPEWMRIVKPCRFPYIAQIGDKVVYFRQGNTAVEMLQLYPVTQRMRPLAELNAEEFCDVVEVKYSRKPYRLTALKLHRLEENGTQTGFVFSVKFHDMDNVPDFIILRSLYDRSVSHRYHPGSRIETILDNHWWTGTIDKKEAEDEENYPRSNWYCIIVKWDTGEDERMSPWDVDPQQPGRRSGIATEKDLIAFAQQPVSDIEWPDNPRGFDGYLERFLEAVRELERKPELRPFISPVNLSKYPEYIRNVDYPVDVDTIMMRMVNRFYRRLLSLEQDIRYIAINANIFNEPGSEIVHNARVLVECLIRYLKFQFIGLINKFYRNTEYSDVQELFDELKNGPITELKEFNHHINKELSVQSKGGRINRQRKNSLGSASSNSSLQWFNDCERIMRNLVSLDRASHFVWDENDQNKETLRSLCDDGCIDLKKMLEKIISMIYTSPLELVADFKHLMETYRNVLDDKRSTVSHLVFS